MLVQAWMERDLTNFAWNYDEYCCSQLTAHRRFPWARSGLKLWVMPVTPINRFCHGHVCQSGWQCRSEYLGPSWRWAASDLDQIQSISDHGKGAFGKLVEGSRCAWSLTNVDQAQQSTPTPFCLFDKLTQVDTSPTRVPDLCWNNGAWCWCLNCNMCSGSHRMYKPTRFLALTYQVGDAGCPLWLGF